MALLQQDDDRFPKLSDGQMEQVRAWAKTRHVEPGEIVFEQGDSHHGIFVVIDGSIEVISVANGKEEVLRLLTKGEFTGEVAQLSGRRSLVRCRASQAGTLFEVARSDLRSLMQQSPMLGEIMLSAFIRRRIYLIAHSVGDAILVGSSHSSDTLRLRGFLGRNGHPYAYIDVETDPDVQSVLDQFAIQVSEVPVLICRGQLVLRNPTNAEAAACFGLNAGIDSSAVYDLIVVGAGPSGLAAAVYGASEGLNVLVIEGSAPGGQAGSSSKIENYLGFPMGISGQELGDRAFIQAEKFGAQIAVARTVRALHCGQPYTVEVDDGGRYYGTCVIIAAGAQYRKLALPNLTAFEGSGIYYGATKLEAQLCEGQEVAVVGGGNSAGQAAMYLSQFAEHVHLLVRGAGLAESMSRYLIARIEACKNLTLHPFCEVRELQGNGRLSEVGWYDKKVAELRRCQIQHLFLMTGADPNTGWLNGCLALDEKQFIRTGAGVGSAWRLARPPYMLETSAPGVFAVGDVRSGSVKRVASAVGEGSMAVQFVHQVLARD